MKIQNYLNEDKANQGKDKLIELRHRIERDIRTGTPAQEAVDKIAEQFGLSKEGNTYKFLLNVAIEYQSHLHDSSIKESTIKEEPIKDLATQWRTDRRDILAKYLSLLKDIDKFSEKYWNLSEQESSQELQSKYMQIAEALEILHDSLAGVSINLPIKL